MPGDQHGRVVKVGRDAGGQPAWPQAPLGFIAIVDQQRAAAGAVAGFDVVQDVADHPRCAQVDVMLVRGAQQHAR